LLDQEEKDEIESVAVKVIILKIEDDFDWMDADLRYAIQWQYEEKMK